MIKKIIKNLIIILFFTLPLINSYLLKYLGFISGDFSIWWEYPKVLFFLIFSWIINFFFIFYLIKNKIKYNYFWLYLFLIFSFISCLFSNFFLKSVFPTPEKWHSFLIFLSLSSLFIIINEIKSKKFIKNLFLASSFSLIFSNIFWLLNLKYNFTLAWELLNRNFATFGHPNYLALFILILLPYWLKNIFYNKSKLNLFFLVFNFIALILSKSYLAIFLFITYLIYFLFKFHKIKTKYFYYFLLIFLWIWFIILYLNISKANSFLSRFFICQSTLEIIFSDIKNIIFWLWFENLWELSVNYKNKMLYIFENFWFFPDRPHNIFLLILNSLWLIWSWFFTLLLYKIYNNYTKEKFIYLSSFVLGVIFLCFNFASISTYSLLILILIKLLDFSSENKINNIFYKLNKYFISIILIINIFWWYIWFLAYSSVILENKQKYRQAYNIYKFNFKNKYYSNNFEIKNEFLEKNKSYNYYSAKLNFSPNKENINEFLNKYNSIESYIFVWNILYNFWREFEAIEYYKTWLNKLEKILKSKNYFDFLITKKRLEWAKIRLNKYWLWEVKQKIKTANY
jgi:hypothetical protein